MGIPPTVDYYPEIDRAIVKYPYDPRRSEQLMAEAGYTRGADGIYTSRSAGAFSAEVRTNATTELVKEMAIMAAQWRQAGFGITELPVPLARARDREFGATFSGLSTVGGSFAEKGLIDFTTSEIASPENGWRRSNNMGWSNAEYDRQFELFTSSLDRSERIQHIVQMAKIFTEELPGIPMHYSLSVIARAGALAGPEPYSPFTEVTWNIHEWQWR